MSLRDELLKVGLINKKQADEAERKQQRQERPPPRQARGKSGKPSHAGPRPAAQAAAPPPLPPKVAPSNAAAAAKLARDMEANRKIQERAERKARVAQITQMIQQNRLPPAENADAYNFVDGAKIRRIGVTPAQRASLLKGEVLIVRHEARYDLIPAALAARLRERDPQLFIASASSTPATAEDDAYADFPIPDDLQW